jgi:hypothetical protein
MRVRLGLLNQHILSAGASERPVVGEVESRGVLIDQGLVPVDEYVEAAGGIVPAEVNLRGVSLAESRPHNQDNRAKR